MRQLLLILVVTTSVLFARAQDTIRLIFAGDAMSHIVQVNWARTADTYDYSPCFLRVTPWLDKADYAVVNLEAPLGGLPYSGFPRFSAPEQYADALSQAGFDLMLLANNHIVDRGKEGLERTIRHLQDNDIAYAGAYTDSESRSCSYPVYKTFTDGFDSLRIAFFNCTYGTNGLPVYAPNIVNKIDTTEIRIDLEETEGKADLRVMCVHWGEEYDARAAAIQHKRAQWLADMGFDLIIGSHPHTVQQYDVITAADGRRVPVFYSLGNLLSNQRWRGCNGGIMAIADLSFQQKRIIRTDYLPLYVYKGMLDGSKQYHLIPTTTVIDTLSRLPIPQSEREVLKVFHNDTKTKLQNLPDLLTP